MLIHTKSGAKWKEWEIVGVLSNKVDEIAYICPVKNALQHTFILLLTLCIFLSSVGVALSAELCLITGIKQAKSVTQQDVCCEKPKKGSDAKEDCCQEDVSYEKLEPVSSKKHFHLEQPAQLTVVVKSFSLQQVFSLNKADELYTYSDSSPPLYGRGLLRKIQILLI